MPHREGEEFLSTNFRPRLSGGYRYRSNRGFHSQVACRKSDFETTLYYTFRRLPAQGQFLRPGQGRLPQRPPGPQLPLRGEPRFPPFGRQPLRGGAFGVNLVDNEVDQKPVNLSAYKTYLTDKMWPKMWFINRGGDLDMNVEDAWAQGYTGKGVKVPFWICLLLMETS